ncbi:MAG: ketopantoate reductase family protein [Clostridiaceae bacterium]
MEIKYLVAGAGGVGGSIGAFLASEKYDVSFIARGRNLETLKKDGLRIDSGIKGKLHLKDIKAYSLEEYAEKADVIFVCVKDYSLDNITPAIKKASHDKTIVIPVLNGLGVGARLKEKLGTGNVADGCIYISAFTDSPGSIIQLGNLFKIFFGAGKGAELDEALLKKVEKDLISCGINAVFSHDIEKEIFRKFSFVSASNTFSLKYDVPIRLIQEEGKYREILKGFFNEIQNIGTRLGFQYEPDLTEMNLRLVDSFKTGASSSMQKDMKAGRKTEIDSLVFSVVRLADSLGIDVPLYKGAIGQ